MSRRLLAWFSPLLALLPPLVALAVQSLFWHWLQPMGWLLCFPAVFVSSWIGGLRGGLWATCVSAALVIYYFVVPTLAAGSAHSHVWPSVVVFCAMGCLFAYVHGELKQSKQRALAMAAELQNVNERLEARVIERTEELSAVAESRRQSDERFAGIIQSATDAIISVDSDRKIILFNAAAEVLFRCTAADVLGGPLDRFIPENLRAAHHQHMRAFGQTGVTSRSMHSLGTLCGVRADGEEFPMEASISQSKMGSQPVYTVILRDITLQQRAQAALKLRQEHSTSLLHLAHRLERAESFTDVLDAASEQLKLVLGLPHAWFYRFSDDRQTMRLIQASDRHDGGEGEVLTIEGDPMLEAIAAAEDIIVVADARTDPRTDKVIVARLGSRTIVNMPVMMSGRRLGVIGAGTFGDEGVRQLRPEDREFFTAVANQVATVLDRMAEMTKREQAEAALQESERLRYETDHRLAEIVHGMTEACFALDAEWRFVFVNDRCETLLKHPRDNVLGKSIWVVFGKLVGTPMEVHYRQAMGDRVPVAFEAFSPIAERWLDIRLFPSGDGLAAFLLDIQERKQSELALRESEERLRIVTENARVGLVVVNKDRRYEYANRTYSEFFRTPQDAIIGQRVEDVVGDYYATEIEPQMDRVFSGERVSFEVCRPKPDGDYYYAAIYEPWRADGVIERMVAVITEITERKQAEQAVIDLNRTLGERVVERTQELTIANEELSHSRAELKSLFESLPGLYLVLTPDLKVVAASDAYLAAAMLPREAVIGNDLFDLFPENPNDPSANGEANLRASLNRVLQDAVADTMAIQKYDIRRPDGEFEEHYWSPVNSPVFGANQAIKFIVHRVEDVTDFVRQKNAASDTHEVQSRLQQMEAEIFNSAQKLQAANQQLQASNKELESFAYSVSHDLRAPLRAMDGFSRALVEDFGPQLPEDGARYVQIIRNSAQKMGLLIDDLLTFSRLSRAPLSTREIDTCALVRAVLEELAVMREGRRFELHVGELAPCIGDPALLRQVWINLLSNAFKYTRNRDPAIIDIGCTSDGKQTTFFVRDNGAGFDMRYAHKLFGVFQRLHRAEDYEGTGVGLAIVQRVIHRHGGSVWAEAAVDQGATFSFKLDGATLS